MSSFNNTLTPVSPVTALTPPIPPKPTYKNLPSEPLEEPLEGNSAEWESRKRQAYLLYDQGSYQEAADLIWEAAEIPSIDIELAFAARILAKASPRKSIRLLTALLELNRGKAVQNLALANALLHHGMVLQAARFYGAALEADPSIGNPDLEHFILWIDDEEKLWGEFKRRRPQLGELPWMRDAGMAMELTNRITLHTTPIKIPSLPSVAGEELRNDLYLQDAKKGIKPTPPPAVTIPMDRVDPKYRRFDSEMGAATTPAPVATPAAVAITPPVAKTAPVAIPVPVAITPPVAKTAPVAIPVPVATTPPVAIPVPVATTPPVAALSGVAPKPALSTLPSAAANLGTKDIPTSEDSPAVPVVNAPSKPKFLFADKKPAEKS